MPVWVAQKRHLIADFVRFLFPFRKNVQRVFVQELLHRNFAARKRSRHFAVKKIIVKTCRRRLQNRGTGFQPVAFTVKSRKEAGRLPCLKQFRGVFPT